MTDRATRICRNCGTRRPINATSCRRCGLPVAEAETETWVASQSTNPEPEPRDPRPEAWADPVASTPPKPSGLRVALRRIGSINGLGALRRLIGLAALVVILFALAYALLPFKKAGASCSPAVVQVFDRQRSVPAAAVGATHVATKGPLKQCTVGAQHRLYDAGPIVLIALIGSVGARRILS